MIISSKNPLEAPFSKKIIILFLFIYGLILFIYFWGYSGINSDPGSFMGFRLNQLNASMQVVNSGGPLLLGTSGTSSSHVSYFPIGNSDDLGIYIFVPALAKIMGMADPKLVMRTFQWAMFLPLVIFYPIIIYYSFGSILISIISSWWILKSISEFFFISDLYWVQIWIILAAMPIIWLVVSRNWTQKNNIIIIVTVLFACSFANCIRSQSGLGVLIAALIILWVKIGWRKSLILGPVLILTVYLFISNYLVIGVQVHRDQVIGQPLRKTQINGHPFWHSAYIGLGNNSPNQYGITYSDNVAYERVKKENPDVVYLSEEYNSILRRAYYDIVFKDPKFVFYTYISKLQQMQKFAFESALFNMFSVIILFVGWFKPIPTERRNLYRNMALITLPILMVSIFPPLVAIVVPSYMLGFLTAKTILWSLLLTYGLEVVRHLWLRWE